MKEIKTSHKRLFVTLAVSALATTMLISPVFAANRTASGLINTDGPHTYIDFKGSWSGREAEIASYLAKYKVVALHYRDSPEHIQDIKAVNRYTVVLGYFNPLYGDEVGSARSDWWLTDTSGRPRTDVPRHRASDGFDQVRVAESVLKRMQHGTSQGLRRINS